MPSPISRLTTSPPYHSSRAASTTWSLRRTHGRSPLDATSPDHWPSKMQPFAQHWRMQAMWCDRRSASSLGSQLWHHGEANTSCARDCCGPWLVASPSKHPQRHHALDRCSPLPLTSNMMLGPSPSSTTYMLPLALVSISACHASSMAPTTLVWSPAATRQPPK
jgi:hypothetical protein